MVKVEIFGVGCPKCIKTEENCKKAAKELGDSIQVVHIYDPAEMLKRGITTSPAVVIDGKLVAAGRVPEVQEIKNWLSNRR
jgi:small redox-active disulfide protein 2